MLLMADMKGKLRENYAPSRRVTPPSCSIRLALGYFTVSPWQGAMTQDELAGRSRRVTKHVDQEAYFLRKAAGSSGPTYLPSLCLYISSQLPFLPPRPKCRYVHIPGLVEHSRCFSDLRDALTTRKRWPECNSN